MKRFVANLCLGWYELGKVWCIWGILPKRLGGATHRLPIQLLHWSYSTLVLTFQDS